MMRITITTSLAAVMTLAVLAFAPAIADTPVLQSGEGTPKPTLMLNLTCSVSGTPADFPNDIVIRNESAFATNPGLPVSYTAGKGNAFVGAMLLPALEPGAFIRLNDVLPFNMPPDSPCTVNAN